MIVEWDLLKISEAMVIMIIMSEKSMSSCSKVMQEWIELDGKGRKKSIEFVSLDLNKMCASVSG